MRVCGRCIPEWHCVACIDPYLNPEPYTTNHTPYPDIGASLRDIRMRLRLMNLKLIDLNNNKLETIPECVFHLTGTVTRNPEP